MRNLIPQGLDQEWNEGSLSDPETNVVGALFILQGKPGDSLEQRLGNYYGTGDASENAEYASSILKAANSLKSLLGGKDLANLSDKECNEIKAAIDKIVHAR